MKKILASAFVIAVINISIKAQESVIIKQLPSVDLKSIKGETQNTSKFSNDGKPIIIDFWATWCKPCIEELNAIHEVYATWQKETGVKVITISVDDARTMTRVAPFVNGKGWTYE